MKVFRILAVAIYGVSATLSSEFVATQWKNFTTKYIRKFLNPKDEAFRRQIFQTNLQRFEEHNEKYKQGIKEGIRWRCCSIPKVLTKKMKVFLILAVAIYGASATLPSEFVATQWQNFTTKYIRKFLNPKDEAFRRQIFQTNLQRFEEHNEKYKQGLVTYTLGVNQFTDRTPDEIRPYTHGLIEPKDEPKPVANISSKKDLGIPQDAQTPSSFDWRSRGVVTPVKNQGPCGSCWAFATTGAIESKIRIAHGSNFDISLSEQQLVDCVKSNFGCGGGWMTDAYAYVAQNGGIDSENAYPYQASNGNCRYKSNQVSAKIRTYAYLTGPDENMLANVVATQGPVSAAFDAEGDLSSYSGGIYYNPNCNPNSFSHAGLIVGYGNENGQDYWLVKNSWGASWGLEGFFKIARNRNNQCGIASKASYPVL